MVGLQVATQSRHFVYNALSIAVRTPTLDIKPESKRDNENSRTELTHPISL